MRKSVLFVLTVLLLVLSAEAQAQFIPGVGWTEQKAQMPPSIWVGITACVGGEPVACLSTDTPVSIVGLRRADISYRLVAATNLPHVRRVTFYVGEVEVDAGYDEARRQWEAEIPSTALCQGANLLRIEVRGRFNSEGVNLLLFRVNWRKSGKIEGQLTLYMRDAWPEDDPAAFFYQNGWVMLTPSLPPYTETETPQEQEQEGQPAPEVVAEPTPAPPTPPAPISPGESGATAVEVAPQPVFYWAGEPIEGTLWVEAGRSLTLRVGVGPGQAAVSWVRPGGEILTRAIEVSPPLIIKLPGLEPGTHQIIVESGGNKNIIEIRAGGEQNEG